MIPTDIRIHQSAKKLTITFENHEVFDYPFEYLRVYSPSAEVRGHHPSQAKLIIGKAGVIIKAVEPVGNYAVKIIFDDGHQSGLYDWNYLYELGRNHAQYWQTYLDKAAPA